MSAGTIALTNNSATVTGTGTSFTTEFKVGDFVGVVVGGAPYTMIVASVTSDTQFTLSVPFNGPSTTGLAWYAIPASLKTAISQQTLNDISTNARGMIQQMDNWQKIYSDDASVTVTRPDRSTFTGPSWGYMANQCAGKMDKSQNLNDVASKTAALNNLGAMDKSQNLNDVASKSQSVSNLGLGWLVSDGSGNYQIGNTGNNLKLFASSGTEFRNTGGAVGAAPTTSDPLWTNLSAGGVSANSWYSASAGGFKYGGALTSNLVIGGSSTRRVTLQHYINPGVDENALLTVLVGGSPTYYMFNNSGYATAPKGWTTASDERIKKDITVIDDPLGKMKLIKGCTWTRVDMEGTGIGFIAQDVQKAFPDSVINLGNRQLPDGTVVKGLLAPDTTGVSAALHHEAILALMKKLESQDAIIAELQSRMKAIDGLDA